MIYVPGYRQAAADMMSSSTLPSSLHMLQINESREHAMDDLIVEQFVVQWNSIQVEIDALEVNSLDKKIEVITCSYSNCK